MIEELIRNKLITRTGSISTQTLVQGRKRGVGKVETKKPHKKSVRSGQVASYHNAHMKGTELERIINEAYEQSMASDGDHNNHS